VNNAGVALGGRFDQVTLEEFDWVMAVNFRAVVRLTHALLPALKAHPGAHVVNVSSVFGIFAPAGQAAYSASKFAVRGFTEALRHELADNGVGVTSVHPGGIKTRIAESARTGSGVSIEEYEEGRKQFAKLLTMPPEKAAAQIVAAIEKRRPRLLIGWSAKVPDVLVRLLPGAYWKLIARRAAPARPAGQPAS
jgi:short-subunit dehydrogenase